jgi:hypothetical protein
MAYMICISATDGTQSTQVEVPDGIPLPNVGDLVGVRVGRPVPVKDRWFVYDDRVKGGPTIYLELEPRRA